jgi:hypothetical protein
LMARSAEYMPEDFFFAISGTDGRTSARISCRSFSAVKYRFSASHYLQMHS